MDLKTIRTNAKETMKGFCRLCPTCDGRACMGEMPGMGGPISSASFINNYQALTRINLNMRVIHDINAPNSQFDFFGKTLQTPIMNGPIGAVGNNCGPYDHFDFQNALMQGMQQAGSIGWIGDPCNEQAFLKSCEAMRLSGGGIAIVKPYASQETILTRFAQAKEAGAIGFGLDVDAAAVTMFSNAAFTLAPKTAAQLRELRAFAPNSPFIVKGIMTPEDAYSCVKAGANCIIASNHGGRMLDCTPGVADVLPAIRRAVGKSAMVIADGGVRSGVDALKYIALGADAVLIGRPACWGIYGGGAEGLQCIVETYTRQLQQAMLLTNCATLGDIDQQVLFGA